MIKIPPRPPTISDHGPSTPANLTTAPNPMMDWNPDDVTSGRSFQYDALGDATSDIRLIEIVRVRDATSRIFCGIDTFSLKNCPDYEALSYAWGNDIGTEDIHLLSRSNSGHFKVTSNLYSALVNLRKYRTVQPADQRRLIWIDAICIDQQSLQERNEQVQRMKSIYERAKRVIVYLGAYDEPLDNRLHFAPDIWGVDAIGAGTYGLTLAAFTVVTSLSAMRLIADNEETTQMLEASVGDMSYGPLSDRRAWAHLSRIFNRPWFERLWIIQELGVSQDSIALCGAISMPWSAIEDAAAFILQPHRSTPQSILRFLPLMGAHRVTQVALNRVRDVDKTNLLTVLRQTQSACCSDPRDKLYAVLGMSDDIIDIEIDYSKSHESVYRHWAVLRILRTKSLDVLGACADSSQMSTQPSWVPNLQRPWAHDRALWRLVQRLNHSPQKPDSFTDYMHIVPQNSSWNLDNLFHGDHLQHSVDGFHVGTIVSLSDVGDAVTALQEPAFLTDRLRDIVVNWESWYAECPAAKSEPPLSVDNNRHQQDHPFRNTLLRKSIFAPDFEKLRFEYENWRSSLGLESKLPLMKYVQSWSSRLRPQRVFEASLFSMIHGFQMFVLRDRLIGMVAANCHAKPGDEVYLLRGGLSPFILRRAAIGHRLISPCFVDGYMDAQTRSFFASPAGEFALKRITLY